MDNKDLTTLRNEAAEQEWHNYDFGDSVVESANGWQYTTPGTEMTRVIFLENSENPEGDSVKAYFTVVFKDETSAQVEEAYASTTSGCDFGQRGTERTNSGF